MAWSLEISVMTSAKGQQDYRPNEEMVASSAALTRRAHNRTHIVLAVAAATLMISSSALAFGQNPTPTSLRYRHCPRHDSGRRWQACRWCDCASRRKGQFNECRDENERGRGLHAFRGARWNLYRARRKIRMARRSHRLAGIVAGRQKARGYGALSPLQSTNPESSASRRSAQGLAGRDGIQ